MSTIYMCGPHKLVDTNEKIAVSLERAGNIVLVPQRICEQEDVTQDRRGIRQKCIAAIDSADALVVYLDNYGMDSAWELGYAEKSGKRIIGLSLDSNKLNMPRISCPQVAWDHWMHGWGEHRVVEGLDALVEYVAAMSVYVSIPVKHEAYDALIQSSIKSHAARIHTPATLIDKKAMSTPHESWSLYRRKCIEAIEDSDIFITYLDEYGMDS